MMPVFPEPRLEMACRPMAEPPAPRGHVLLADGMTFAPGEKKRLLSKAGIEELEGEILNVPGTTEFDLPLEHLFQPGVYLRKITMPEGSFVLGTEHQEAHYNIILKGRVTVIAEGKVIELKAGDIFFSNAGVRKVLKNHETVEWITVHPNPTDERDITTLEKRLAILSPTYKEYFAKLKPMPPTPQ